MADKQCGDCPLGIKPIDLGTRLGNIETTGEIIIGMVEKVDTKLDKQNGRIGGLEKADVAHHSRLETLENRPGVAKQTGIIGGILGVLIAIKEFLIK